MCERCEKKPAKGGHRYCYGCIGQLLSQLAEQPRSIRQQPATTYPINNPRKPR